MFLFASVLCLWYQLSQHFRFPPPSPYLSSPDPFPILSPLQLLLKKKEEKKKEKERRKKRKLKKRKKYIKRKKRTMDWQVEQWQDEYNERRWMNRRERWIKRLSKRWTEMKSTHPHPHLPALFPFHFPRHPPHTHFSLLSPLFYCISFLIHLRLISALPASFPFLPPKPSSWPTPLPSPPLPPPLLRSLHPHTFTDEPLH